MSEVTSTAKTALVYSVGLIINQLAAFLLLPVYTRYLTPADYGTIELLIMTTDVAGLIAGVGIASAVMKFYFASSDESSRKRLLFTALLMSGVLYLIFSLCGLLFSDQLATLVLEGTADNSFAFKIVFIIFAIEPIFLLTMVLLRIQQQAKLFVLMVSLRLLLQICLNIIFVVLLGKGYLGVLYATLISWITLSFWALPYYLKHSGIVFSQTVVRQLLAFGAPLILLNIGNFVITFSDRFFLKAFADMTTVGLYSLGYKMGFVLGNLTTTPLMSTWEPKRFQLSGNEDFSRVNRLVFLYFSILLVSVALGIALFSRDLFRVMSAPEFASAYRIVPLVMVAYVCQGWTEMTNYGIYHAGKTRYFAFVGFFCVCLIVALSFWLIPLFHAFGAALATVLTFGARFALVYWRSQALFRLDYAWKQVVVVLIWAVGVFVVTQLVVLDDILLSVTLNGVFFLIFILGIVFFPILSPIEKKKMRLFVVNKISAFRKLKS